MLYGSLTILTEVPERVYERCTRTPTRTPVFYKVSGTGTGYVSRYFFLFSGHFSYTRAGYGMLYPYPGYCGTGVHTYVAHGGFGYGYECHTEVAEVPGRGMYNCRSIEYRR